MRKKLKSLDDANREAHERHRAATETRNGIACPQCGDELHDIKGITLASKPPKIHIECRNPSCNYKGTRIR